jgi:hypothetical protein
MTFKNAIKIVVLAMFVSQASFASAHEAQTLADHQHYHCHHNASCHSHAHDADHH